MYTDTCENTNERLKNNINKDVVQRNLWPI